MTATDSTGAVADALTSNALTVTGCVVGGVGVAGATFVGAMVAPLPVIGLTATGALCVAAGTRVAAGKPVIPGMGADKQASPAAATTDAPAASAA